MDDMISRQAAIETVRKAKSIGQAHRMLVQLPSAQPVNIAKLQPNCNQVASDCISRQAAIKAADSIIERDTSGNNDVVKAMTAWQEYIKALPSAQPGYEDAVSRKAAIDALPYLLDYEGFKGESGYVSKNLVRIMLKGLPPVTPKQPGWIPCSERCPENYDNYLITTEDRMVVFGVYDPREKQWCRYDSIKSLWLYGIKVIAWQPLPTPYRGGGQNDGKN